MQIVTECRSIFNFRLPSVIIPDRCETFRVKQATSLAITRYTSFPCPRCKICCICNLSALFTVYFVSYVRLTILHIDCILVFIVYCSLFVFSLYHSLMNTVAHCYATLAYIGPYDTINVTTYHRLLRVGV